MVTWRPYAGAVDLRRMQDLVTREAATTSMRAGDLAWLSRHGTHRELARDIGLWEDGGDLVAWVFLRRNGGFNAFTAGGAERLLDELLTFVDAELDPSVEAYTYDIDESRSARDRALADALRRWGFAEAPSTGVLARSLDGDLPAPPLPPGYRLTGTATAEEVHGRVAAHLLAYQPSTVTSERYQRVRRTWPYRPELDRLVVHDDDGVVAFCTAWIDEANRSGHFEPVGTVPAHRRRGLGRAVCADALRALREAGARTASTGYADDAALATYRSIGFEPVAADTSFRRPVRAGTGG